VKQRFVRPGDSLEDEDEVVLRGGRLDAAILRVDAQRMHDIYGAFGISVFALRGATIDELAQQVPLVRFAELTVVTVGVLRDVGVRLEATGRNPRHFTVVLDDLENATNALVACAHRTWVNPYHEP
jgi:uncharacterized membrane protein YeiH